MKMLDIVDYIATILLRDDYHAQIFFGIIIVCICIFSMVDGLKLLWIKEIFLIIDGALYECL